MRKLFLFLVMLVAFGAASFAQNTSANKVVGKLTAYYAKKTFGDYTKGQLIVDTNDPINRMVNLNASKYKYEGDETGGYYSKQILKSNVTVKSFTMNELPVSMIGNGLVFKASNGETARIFKAKNNGHSYYTYDSDFNPIKNTAVTSKLDGCYVLSFTSFYMDEGQKVSYVFEEQLEVENGNIKLYVKNRFGDTGVRRRVGKIGFIEEQWCPEENYPYGEPTFDANGNLLVDQYSTQGSIPEYISIAYIASLKALYIKGTLYYLEK